MSIRIQQVPSFYPDPDQTHGGATFEGDTQDGGGIEADVTSETTSDTSALTPAAPPNGGIKVYKRTFKIKFILKSCCA